MGKCKFCEQNKKLIKAHILPQPFYQEIIEYNKNSPILISKDKKYIKRIPIGIYDKNILCKKCDGKFGKYDKYAIKFFKQNFESFYKNFQNKEFYLLNKDDFDYKTLKLFFISLIWRASISYREEMNDVELGEYENIAKNILLNEELNGNFTINIIHFKRAPIYPFISFFEKFRNNKKIIGYKFVLFNFLIHIFPKGNLNCLLNQEKLMIPIINKLHINGH